MRHNTIIDNKYTNNKLIFTFRFNGSTFHKHNKLINWESNNYEINTFIKDWFNLYQLELSKKVLQQCFTFLIQLYQHINRTNVICKINSRLVTTNIIINQLGHMNRTNVLTDSEYTEQIFIYHMLC